MYPNARADEKQRRYERTKNKGDTRERKRKEMRELFVEIIRCVQLAHK